MEPLESFEQSSDRIGLNFLNDHSAVLRRNYRGTKVKVIANLRWDEIKDNGDLDKLVSVELMRRDWILDIFIR